MKTQEEDGILFVLADNGKAIGRFEQDVDGYFYFWEEVELDGCWTAHNLRQIADLLDKINEPYDKQVNEFFELERRNFEEKARVEYRKLLNETGMFFEFYPQLTGEWGKDKQQWFIEFEKLEQQRKATWG
jgi:hypothetical protein